LCDVGGGNAARELAGLLRERGDLDGLCALANVLALRRDVVM
jgi:hypothetical protein